VAAFVGFGLFRLSWRINLKRFFQVTGVFLIIVAAGLFQFGVHELQGAYGWGLDGEVYNVKSTLPDKLPEDGSAPTAAQVAGALLRGIFGYNDDPTQLEMIAYGAYWAFTLVAYWGVRTGKIEIVTRPLRNAWRAIVRAVRRSPAKVGVR